MVDHSMPSGHTVKSHLSDSLYHALKVHCEKTGESISHVIQRALSDVLDVEHHTIYQVSTATALVQGVYQGCVTVGNIKTHGDFGLGTFDALNGEGLMLDGHVYQATGDGKVVEPPDSTTAPFWVCTAFESEQQHVLDTVASWDDLLAQLDKLRESDNLFVAFRIEGVFTNIHYRVACKSAPGTDLVTATSHQAEFNLENCEGTLMGFWAPAYARTFNIPGYHLHLLSSDHTHGGHVLGLQATNLKVQVMTLNNVVMALPESPDFLKADLSGDPTAALGKAEGAR